jgi:hypothetical protein
LEEKLSRKTKVEEVKKIKERVDINKGKREILTL